MSEVSTPWSSVGYLTMKRTYARRINGTDQTEEFPQIVDRVLKACDDQLHVGFTMAEKKRLRNYLLHLKGSVAGRFMWQLGTETVDRLGLLSLQNCVFTVVDEPVRPFTWVFDALMLGAGAGFNIQREYVYKLPTVRDEFVAPARLDTKDADFIVPDSREGWVRLIHNLLYSAFHKVDQDGLPPGFTYSTQLIRGKGAPIKGFGGTASGSEDLVQGVVDISAVISNRAGKQLRPIDCLDIMNILGRVVVSGNVRRSALLAIGDADDIQYLKAKNWSSGKIPNWRSMSNNSVICNNINDLPDEFWKTYMGGAEPYGLINIKLARSCGRTGDTQYKDKGVRGFNPCAEQSLEPYESCCLAEIMLPLIKSKEEMIDLVKLLYRVNKHSLALKCHAKETEKIVHKNMRMGIGITGYLEASEEQRQWLPDVYEELRQFDVDYSKEHGYPVSIKLSTCKPSGTISLLPGVTPGVHPAFARYMIRRIRISSDHPLVKTCRDHGYKVEYQRNFDHTEDRSTVVVEFPFRYSDNAVLANEVSATQQLDWVRRLQKDWSDNSVSVTVYYKPEELDDIKAYLKEHYNKELKTVSFLLHDNHGFDQAPYEEISKEEYDRLVAKTTVISSIDDAGTYDPEFDKACEGGVCPVR